MKKFLVGGVILSLIVLFAFSINVTKTATDLPPTPCVVSSATV